MHSGRFIGGRHTEIKIETIKKYLCAYTRALHEKFELVYIDAFAGSGDYSIDYGDGGLFPEEKSGLETRPGSARMALEVLPPFERLIFVDKDLGSLRALQKIKETNGGRNIEIINGDANDIVQRICRTEMWHKVQKKNGTRAIVFLDPFALSVNWETIKAIGQTRAIDLWYLFPIEGIRRLLPHDGDCFDPANIDNLNIVLGKNWWMEEFYSREVEVTNLFGDQELSGKRRLFSSIDIEVAFTQRMRPHFGYVAPRPLQLFRKNSHIFSLFFAVANRSRFATELAERITTNILEIK